MVITASDAWAGHIDLPRFSRRYGIALGVKKITVSSRKWRADGSMQV
jgi:hypothetical protein